MSEAATMAADLTKKQSAEAIRAELQFPKWSVGTYFYKTLIEIWFLESLSVWRRSLFENESSTYRDWWWFQSFLRKEGSLLVWLQRHRIAHHEHASRQDNAVHWDMTHEESENI